MDSIDSAHNASLLNAAVANTNVVEFRPPTLNLPWAASPQRSEGEPLSLWKARAEHEKTSSIIKAGTAYCCSKSTLAAGFIADHTCDGVFAGFGGIVGEKHVRTADRSMRELAKLIDSAAGVMSVELRSLASVAGFVLKESDDSGIDMNGAELTFLKSFARLVGRLSKEQYDRESATLHSR
jgi:hypothetical protein